MSLSDVEQYLLELMNRARLDPAGEAARMGIDLNQGLSPGQIAATAQQVLAPNAMLETAATKHSLWMLSADVFSHTGVNGTDPGQRMAAEGYQFSLWGENLALKSLTVGQTAQALIEDMNKALFLSVDHRVDLLNGAFREVGLGAEAGVFTQAGNNFNVEVITEDFGKTGSAHFLTGVAYTDTNADRFYSLGEGTANVVFSAAGLTTSTATAGGYALTLNSQTAVAVTGHVGAINFALTVDMSPGNVKLDVVSGTTFYTSGSVTLGTGINNVLFLGIGGLNATGNDLANVLTGNAAANTLSGMAGLDVLLGNAGSDMLSGGAGNDRLTGGLGNDVLTGGAGIDRFIFAKGDGNDHLTDFRIADGDRLSLDHTLWTGLTLKSGGVVTQFAHKIAGEVFLDFGNGDQIHLTGLTSLNGIGAMIDIF
jgi:serralysin